MKKSIAPLLALGSAAVFWVSLAIAQPMSARDGDHCSNGNMSFGHGGDRLMPEDRLGLQAPWFVRGIDLTEAQQDQIFKILYAQVPMLRAKEKSVRDARSSLQAMVISGEFDEAKAKSLAKSIADDSAAMLLMRAQSEQQIYGLLTPDQRKQLERSKADRNYQPTDSAGRKLQAMMRAI